MNMTNITQKNGWGGTRPGSGSNRRILAVGRLVRFTSEGGQLVREYRVLSVGKNGTAVVADEKGHVWNVESVEA